MKCLKVEESEKPRIWLYVNKVPPEHDGTGKRCVAHAENLKKCGYDIAILTNTQNPDSRNALNIMTIQRILKHGLFSQYLNLWRLYKNIKKYIAIYGKPEIIHSFGGGITSSIICYICRKHGIKSIIEFVVTLPPKNMKYRINPNTYLRNYSLKYADQIMANSNGVRLNLMEIGIVRNIKVINNAIDVNKYKIKAGHNKHELRKLLGLPIDSTLILMVGYIGLRKGYDRAIKVIHKLKKEVNVNLIIVGPYNSTGLNAISGKLSNSEQSTMNSDCIKYCGYKENVINYYHACDILLFPSRKEGFPNVLLEAMAASMIVISANLDGISNDIIEHDKDGYIVENNDNIDEYIYWVKKTITNRHKSSMMREQSKRSVEKKYDKRIIIKEHLINYEKVIKNNSKLPQ